MWGNEYIEDTTFHNIIMFTLLPYLLSNIFIFICDC